MGCNTFEPIYVGFAACVTALPPYMHETPAPLHPFEGNAVTQASDPTFYGGSALHPRFRAKVTR